MGYWTGLAEGFSGRREAEYKKNYERELQNREMSDRVFTHLLNSRDPEMQQLALQGLMAPIGKKKGFKGFMGEIDPAAAPFLSQITARMNEMVPGEAPAPPPEGAAAMSTNQPVHAGSAPIASGSPTPEAPVGGEPPAAPEMEMGGGPPMAPQLGPAAGGAPPGMAAPPPPSPFKRRGTGVPNAEEIAEANARAQLQGRITAAKTALIAQGATPEEIETAIMGLAGAPRSQRNLSAINSWGIKLPSGQILPVLLDQSGGGYRMPDGSPIPPDAQMVRMGGGAAGGALTTKIPDTPEARQYLIAQGVDPVEIAGGSPSGYWKLVTRADGTVGVQADMYTPPPAYSGTIEGTDPNNPQVPVRIPVRRGGGTGPPLADVDQPVKSQLQLDAESLKTAIDDEIKLMMGSSLGRLRGVSPAQRDAIVRQKASAQNLPWTTYDEVVRATSATTPITPRQRSEGGTTAERVLREAMAERQRQSGAGSVPPPPAGPAAAPPRVPQRPSARSTGAGPVR